MAIKIVLLGDCSVGKTSIALRFVNNEFNHYTESTIGASFLSKAIQVKIPGISTKDQTTSSNVPTKKIRLQIWDTAGQEKYHALAPMYYRGAQAAILVYDISNPQSFEHLKIWVQELHDNNNRSTGGGKIILFICGNKYDLKNDRRISEEEAQTYAKDVDASYIETSARDGTNVHDLFHSIAQQSLRLNGHIDSDDNEVIDDEIIDFAADVSKECRTCC